MQAEAVVQVIRHPVTAGMEITARVHLLHLAAPEVETGLAGINAATDTAGHLRIPLVMINILLAAVCIPDVSTALMAMQTAIVAGTAT
jgi:hypothetical protein